MKKSSTHFAYHHMHLTDNGRGSRWRLLPQRGFKPPSQVHSQKTVLPHSHQPAALWIHPFFRTSLAQRFINIGSIIFPQTQVVNKQIKKVEEILSGRKKNGAKRQRTATKTLSLKVCRKHAAESGE
jgi:hypothetical protein